jgi:protein-disulfide isomerase
MIKMGISMKINLQVVLTLLMLTTLFSSQLFSAVDDFDGPKISIKDAPMRGNPKAPVTLVEFSDFQCPMCGTVQPTLQRLKENYPDKVRFVFKHFPLQMHSDARLAHMASVCAEEQGKFWEYRDHLFNNQRALKRNYLIGYAKELGLNEESFAHCVDDNRYAERVEADYQEAVRFGMRGTPAFVINRQVVTGAYPYPAFEEAVEEELRHKDRS